MQPSFHCEPIGATDKLNATGILRQKGKFHIDRTKGSVHSIVLTSAERRHPLPFCCDDLPVCVPSWVGLVAGLGGCWGGRGLLRLLGGADYDRRRLDGLRELRLCWIVCSSWKGKNKKLSYSLIVKTQNNHKRKKKSLNGVQCPFKRSNQKVLFMIICWWWSGYWQCFSKMACLPENVVFAGNCQSCNK